MKIYIAGPDVFEPDAVSIGRRYKNICAEYGHEGLYPLDNECDSSEEIYKGNIELIDNADAVVANGNEFRGEMDVGTAFEVGFAAARGKKIIIYTDDARSLVEKYGEKDEKGRITENFGKPLNLMLAESSEIICGSFEDAIKKLSR